MHIFWRTCGLAIASLFVVVANLASAAEAAPETCEGELFSLDQFKTVSRTDESELRHLTDMRRRYQRELDSLNARISAMELGLQYTPERARKEALTELNDKLKTNPRLALHLQDYLNFKWFKRHSPPNLIFLIGTPGVKVDAAVLQDAKERVEKAIGTGHHIVFDGASPYTPALAKVAGAKAIVVAAAPVKGVNPSQMLILTNAYLRQQVFGFAESITAVSSDSVAGAAGLFTGGVTQFISATRTELEKLAAPLSQWWQFVWRNNHSVYRVPQVPHAWLPGEPPWRPLGRRHERKRMKLEDWETEDLKKAAAYANETLTLERAVSGPQAVIFGGSQVFEKSNFDTYNLAYELGLRGIGTVTGGAGGIMLAANMGAFDAGAESVGIPIAGGKVEMEGTAYKEFHTVTAFANDYDTRVPALLKGRRYVIFEPGGSGTMREIAAALYALTLPENADMEIYFVNKKYYEAAFEFIQSLEVPKKILNRIHLADNAEDLINLIQVPALPAATAGAAAGPKRVGSWTALNDRMRKVERR